MSDLIERKELQKQMARPKVEINDGQDYADWYIHCVATAPTVDAEIVRHGHMVWKMCHSNSVTMYTGFDENDEKHTIRVFSKFDGKLPYCSECGKALNADDDYCNHCGAHMDAKEDKPNE